MILLDTNVLSEAIKPAPEPRVLHWLEKQDRNSVYSTTVTVAEMLAGVALLPDGRRKLQLATAVETLFTVKLEGRVVAFDDAAAGWYARVFAVRVNTGRPLAHLDAMIAAIAAANSATLATRNTADFAGCGIALVNPWE